MSTPLPTGTPRQPPELKRDAFGEMRAEVAEKTDRPVFAGRHD